jgi:ribosome maturation factor RimP
VSDVLDVEDVVPGEYNLEVSSPGLFRPLTKAAHFERAVGERIKVKTYEKQDGRRVFTGILEARDEDRLVVRVDDGQTFEIPLGSVAKANLEPHLDL